MPVHNCSVVAQFRNPVVNHCGCDILRYIGIPDEKNPGFQITTGVINYTTASVANVGGHSPLSVDLDGMRGGAG